MKPTIFPIGFRLALGFLTTLPILSVSEEEFNTHSDAFGRSFAWYPIIGLLIGAILGATVWLLHFTNLNPLVQAGLLMTAWVLVTGGLHLDGLMDSCDALFAPVSVERRLEILKDVHTGAFGVLGLLLLIGLKWATLSQLIDTQPENIWIVLLVVPLWGRWILVWAAQRYPYARADTPSLGNTMRRGLADRQLLFASLWTILIFAGIVSFQPFMLWALVGPVIGLLIARWAASQLNGGLTGDLYGALCEVTEFSVLLSIAI